MVIKKGDTLTYQRGSLTLENLLVIEVKGNVMYLDNGGRIYVVRSDDEENRPPLTSIVPGAYRFVGKR